MVTRFLYSLQPLRVPRLAGARRAGSSETGDEAPRSALRPGQPSPYNVLPWLTLGLIAVGIIYQYLLGRFRPDALANAPALLEGEPDETTDGSDSQALVA